LTAKQKAVKKHPYQGLEINRPLRGLIFNYTKGEGIDQEIEPLVEYGCWDMIAFPHSV